MSWPLIALGELICDERSGASLTSDEFTDSGVPVVPKKAISDSVDLLEDTLVFTSEKKYLESKGAHVDHRYLITTLRNLNPDGSTLGLICRNSIKAEFMLAQGMHAFRTNELVDSNYLCFASRQPAFRKEIQKVKVGSTQVHIRARELKEIKIPLPSLEEQKRIAAILDKADAIRRKRQQAIKLADDFLRSVFLEMFGDPVTNPKGWEVRSVGEVADCIVPGRDKPKSFTGSTPWVTTNDLNHLGFTHCSKSNIGLSGEEIKNVRARVVPKNSVLMTCVGDIGVISISGNDMVINQQLHAFLPSEKHTSTYLAYALSFQKGYMTSMASSTTLPYMNKTICNSVPVAVSPLPLQLKFESIFMHVNELKNKLQRQEVNPLFNSLSQTAFSGNL